MVSLTCTDLDLPSLDTFGDVCQWQQILLSYLTIGGTTYIFSWPHIKSITSSIWSWKISCFFHWMRQCHFLLTWNSQWIKVLESKVVLPWFKSFTQTTFSYSRLVYFFVLYYIWLTRQHSCDLILILKDIYTIYLLLFLSFFNLIVSSKLVYMSRQIWPTYSRTVAFHLMYTHLLAHLNLESWPRSKI